MSPAAVEELRLCHAATTVEAAMAEPGARAWNAEALQKALFRHRDEILQVLNEREALDLMIDDMLTGLRPFGRVAQILAPGVNPVLFSIPAAGGRHFVQLRPEHFRRAAELTRMPA